MISVGGLCVEDGFHSGDRPGDGGDQLRGDGRRLRTVPLRPGKGTIEGGPATEVIHQRLRVPTTPVHLQLHGPARSRSLLAPRFGQSELVFSYSDVTKTHMSSGQTITDAFYVTQRRQ